MTTHIAVERFTKELYALLDETFEQVHGHFLDRNTSLFETLATISAEEASRPVSARCASIAAQVNHVRFYIAVLERLMRGEEVGRIDWAESWRVQHVTGEEWEALKGQLKAAYQSALSCMERPDNWRREDSIGEAMAILVHTAYHLGEIRQALCTIKQQASSPAGQANDTSRFRAATL